MRDLEQGRNFPESASLFNDTNVYVPLTQINLSPRKSSLRTKFWPNLSQIRSRIDLWNRAQTFEYDCQFAFSL